jgi:hypothetical protein
MPTQEASLLIAIRLPVTSNDYFFVILKQSKAAVE